MSSISNSPTTLPPPPSGPPALEDEAGSDIPSMNPGALPTPGNALPVVDGSGTAVAPSRPSAGGVGGKVRRFFSSGR